MTHAFPNGRDQDPIDAEAPPETAEAPGRLSPRSERGARTRAALVSAARVVFERDGYLDARVSDITGEAGVASGSFYTYFNDKEEVFAAVMHELQDEMIPDPVGVEHTLDTAARIAANNRAYLEAYQRNAKLMAVVHQVSTINDNFRQLRLRRSRVSVERSARAIRRLQNQGLVDEDLEAEVTAHALLAMVSGAAYQAFVLGEDIPFDTLVTTVNQLWMRGLGLTE